ncbi:lethal(3)malignant brain tumor-like protein 1 [Pollicipes pollicipes]|uniref:lethal(3)malignant brain tumor-like protein 1 n=1 Tax=Pollicipes pollicipes TaxID=41117 RepID=UPI0018858C0F|nr:lethal(3)malignant brain tumor-like protein 1 [Pollicipes pollicipes]
MWNRAGFADLVRLKSSGLNETQLYLSELGVVEVADTEAEGGLAPGQAAPGAVPAVPGRRQPGALCCCSNCGCFGEPADFYADGAFCGKVCHDVAAGRAAIKKKRAELADKKKRKLADVEEEDEKDVKPWKKLHEDSPPLVYGGGSFSWSRYLRALSRSVPAARAAPELGPELPEAARFLPGQRLEAVDPARPELICACTVAEVVGSRLRVHFDGYSVRFDFWTDASSRLVFPCGWTERHWAPACSVRPPRGHVGPFSWPAYLRQQGAQAAPDRCFSGLDDLESPFKRVSSDLHVGHRLEAADVSEPRHMRPARVAQVRAFQFLVEFDGAAAPPGFWAELDSPRVRPVAWGEEHGLPVLPADGPEARPFSWQSHLVETRSLPAPVPALVRVMHVVEVTRHGLCVADCPYVEDAERRHQAADRLTSELPEEPDLTRYCTGWGGGRRGRGAWRGPRPDSGPPSSRGSVHLHRDLSSIASEVSNSVFDSKDRPVQDVRAAWPRCPLLRRVDRFLAEHRAVHLWGANMVRLFLEQFAPPAADARRLQTFVDEEIDGESLLLLTRDDLRSLLKLSLGTAIKLHGCIVRMRKHFNYRGQKANANGSRPTSRSSNGSRLNSRYYTCSRLASRSNTNSRLASRSNTDSRLASRSKPATGPRLTSRSYTDSRLAARSNTDSRLAYRSNTDSRTTSRSYTDSRLASGSNTNSRLASRSNTNSRLASRSYTDSRLAPRSNTNARPTSRSNTDSRLTSRSKPVTGSRLATRSYTDSRLASRSYTDPRLASRSYPDSRLTSRSNTDSRLTSRPKPVTGSRLASRSYTDSGLTSRSHTDSRLASRSHTDSGLASRTIWRPGSAAAVAGGLPAGHSGGSSARRQAP